MSFRHAVVLSAALALAAMAVRTAAQQDDAASPASSGDHVASSMSAANAASTPAAGASNASAAAATRVAGTAATETQDDGGPLGGDPTAGQAKSATCAACHGLDGNSSDPQYPKLAGQRESYIVRQLALFKSGKRQNAIMLGFASQLSPQDMHDVGAYFAEQKMIPGVADDKLVKLGHNLYTRGDASRDIPACMACHSPDGRGNPGAMYPQLAGQHADYLQKTLKAWHDGTSWGDSDHAQIMPTIAARLSEDDIVALSSYLEGLHHAEAGDSGEANMATAASDAGAASTASAASAAPASAGSGMSSAASTPPAAAAASAGVKPVSGATSPATASSGH